MRAIRIDGFVPPPGFAVGPVSRDDCGSKAQYMYTLCNENMPHHIMIDTISCKSFIPCEPAVTGGVCNASTKSQFSSFVDSPSPLKQNVLLEFR